MSDFKDKMNVTNYIVLCPSQYALHYLKNFKYLVLWYLTQEGCTNVAQHHHSQNNDTFGLTKVGDVVALCQISAVRASKKVISNANLSFRQMSIAKTTLLQQITKLQWPLLTRRFTLTNSIILEN